MARAALAACSLLGLASAKSFQLTNSRGVVVDLIPEGATIQRLLVPNANGTAEDIVLGYDSPSHYSGDINPPYFGGVVGRVANRIANATFSLGGRQYRQQANENNRTSLHSGPNSLQHRTWAVEAAGPYGVTFSIVSPAGDDGFPGAVNATVTYELDDDNVLRAEIEATSTAPTPVNFAQHSYFNLNGEASGSILGHWLKLNASYYLPVDGYFIPTGAVAPVQGTPFDFLQPHTIGDRISQVTFPPPAGGYDHNWVLFGLTGEEAKDETVNCAVAPEPQVAATLWSPESGRALELSTNQPGLQFYAGNQLDGTLRGKGGYAYQQHGGFAIETQVFPNFVNTPAFAGCILAPGETYRHVWQLRFFNSSELSTVTQAPTALGPQGAYPQGAEAPRAARAAGAASGRK